MPFLIDPQYFQKILSNNSINITQRIDETVAELELCERLYICDTLLTLTEFIDTTHYNIGTVNTNDRNGVLPRFVIEYENNEDTVKNIVSDDNVFIHTPDEVPTQLGYSTYVEDEPLLMVTHVHALNAIMKTLYQGSLLTLQYFMKEFNIKVYIVNNNIVQFEHKGDIYTNTYKWRMLDYD